MRRILAALGRYPVITATVAVGIIAAALAGAGQSAWATGITTAYVSAVVVWTIIGMIRDVMRGHVGLDVLAVIAMVATLAVGETIAALIIVLMLSGGEALEDYAGRRATRELTALLDRAPQIARPPSGRGR
jgi:cation transport ATPase